MNLGICKNLDRSFSLSPLPGSVFLCVLEDDNFFLPMNLERNMAALNQRGTDVLLRNQCIEYMREKDKPGELSDRTSFDGQYRDGILAHRVLFATFFYSTGANNSSLFWRANAGLDFSTVKYLNDPVSQERLRTLCIDRDVVIGLEPTIIWRDNGEESLRPKLKSWLSWRLSQIAAASNERAIYRALHTYLGAIGAYDLAFAPIAGCFSAEKERVFVRCGIPVPVAARRLTLNKRLFLHFKRTAAQIARVLLSKNPVLHIDPCTRRLS